MAKRIFIYCDTGYIPNKDAAFTDDLRQIADLIDGDNEHEAFIIEFKRDGMVNVNHWKSLKEFYQVMSPDPDVKL